MFPSIFNTFNRPNPTDRLNNPSHSALHNTVSSALGQVQAVIGLNSGANASALGTLMYDIRSPLSNGGGHIQAVNKGGTGQTAFTKGDQLVASSSSVLSKVAVGVDGQVWVADSSVASGIKWGSAVVGNKIANSGSLVGILFPTPGVDTSIISVSIPASTLGVSGAIKTTMFVKHWQGDADAASVLLSANYGNTRVASILFYPTRTLSSINGIVEYTLISNGAPTAQIGNLSLGLTKNDHQSIGGVSFGTGPAAEDSDAAKIIGLSAIVMGAASSDRIFMSGYTIEKIT